MKTILLSIPILLLCIQTGCKSSKTANQETMTATHAAGTFGYDLDFLKKYQQTVVLKRDSSLVCIIPAYQGRVMTSAASGMNGMSFGWINYKLIESGEVVPHFNNYGGEERFWLGPEGGQFSLYFKPGVPFQFENWQVPAPIDMEAFDLVSSDDTTAIFRKDMQLINYSRTAFKLRVDRAVKLLENKQVEERIGKSLPQGINGVAYETTNTITNVGPAGWNQSGGLLSIWMLGQLISSPTNVVLAPYIPGSEEELGPVVNDSYFGKVPDDRLKVLDSLILFKADGLQRGKIGLTPERARNFLGSYDFGTNVLTLLFYNKPDTYEGYVNSMWEIQEKPFKGDVVNSYNDGPLEDGSQLGPFYELEASSPAKSLLPGQSLSHVNLTVHLSGTPEQLNPLVESLFGISIDRIKTAFNQ